MSSTNRGLGIDLNMEFTIFMVIGIGWPYVRTAILTALFIMYVILPSVAVKRNRHPF